jgi:hypothetical protein
MKFHLNLLVTFTCAALYGTAFLVPAVNISARDIGYGSIPGWIAFLASMGAFIAPGGWDFFRIVLAASWLANPAICCGLACIVVGHVRWADFFGLTGFMLALSTLIEYRAAVCDQPGYWLWVASAGVLFVGALMIERRAPLYIPESIELTILPRTSSEQQGGNGVTTLGQFSGATIQR